MIISHLQGLVGKVVTIRSISGEEYIATLKHLYSEPMCAHVTDPKVIVIDNDHVVLLPFALTADAKDVYISMNNIFSVMETYEQTAKDYLDTVTDNK